jgi:hypothetical protein
MRLSAYLLDALQQFVDVERFRQEVGCSHFRRPSLRIVHGGHDDDRKMLGLRVGTKAARHLEAVHHRHHQIEQYHMRIEVERVLHSVLTHGEPRLVSLEIEHTGYQRCDILLVFDNEYPFGHDAHLLGRCAPERGSKVRAHRGKYNADMPDRGYAGRDVLDKLGIKPGHAIALRDLDPTLARRIAERAGSSGEPYTSLDIVIVAIDQHDDATAVLIYWRERIRPAGSIWLLMPKRGHPGYVDQHTLIGAGKRAGLVDNKVCSVSDGTSAMRFVIRREDRVRG